MTQEISKNWLAKDGQIKPSQADTPKDIQAFTYPCPTLKDGEYRGEDLEFYHQLNEGVEDSEWFSPEEHVNIAIAQQYFGVRNIIRLKQSPAIDAGQTKQSVSVEEDISHLAGLSLSEIYLHGVIAGQKQRIEQLDHAIQSSNLVD